MYHTFLIDPHHRDATNILCRNLRYLISYVNTARKPLAFICIGSTKIPGDNLGPIVGTILHSIYPHVYGTLDSPVHAMNLPYLLPSISIMEQDFCVIIIDASFDNTYNSNLITICDTGLSPRSGLCDSFSTFPDIGHIQITGIFNELGTEKAQTILPLYCRNIGLGLLKLFC